MAPPLVILAEQREWDALRLHSLLPEQLFCQHDPENPETTVATARFERVPTLEPPADPNDRDAHELFTAFVDSLLGRDVIHLLVLPLATDSTFVDGEALRAVVAWQQAVNLAITAAAQHRNKEIRFFAVIVCEGFLPPDLKPDLIALRNSPGVRRAYLMLDRLETAGTSALFARHVWPSAVGRLLLRLDAATSDGRGWMSDEMRNTFYAWRAFELLPSKLEQDEESDLEEGNPVADALAKLYEKQKPERLSGWPEEPMYTAKCAELDNLASDSQLPDWTDYDVVREISNLSSQCSEKVREAGRARGLARGGQAQENKAETPADSVSQDAWKNIHESVARLRTPENWLPARPSNDMHEAARIELPRVDGLRTARDRAHSLQKDFDAAVNFRLSGMVALASICAVALFFGYFALLGLRLIYGGGWLLPLAVSLAVLAGGAVAAGVVVRRESVAGRHAMLEARRSLAAMLEAWRNDVDAHLTGLSRAAQKRAHKRKVMSHYTRLVALVRRAKNMVDSSIGMAAGNGGDLGADDNLLFDDNVEKSNGKQIAFVRNQRAAFRRAMTLEITHPDSKGSNTMTREESRQRREEAVENWKNEFVKKWSKLCDKFDPAELGRLPRVPVMRFIEEQLSSLEALFRDDSVERLRHSVPKEACEWSMKDSEKQKLGNFRYGLSCYGLTETSERMQTMLKASWAGEPSLHLDNKTVEKPSNFATDDSVKVMFGMYFEEIRCCLLADESGTKLIPRPPEEDRSGK